MGVKTNISLKKANSLFDGFSFKKLSPTTSGIMDTTYFADNFILKKYERDVDVKRDIKLLQTLKNKNLNVPTCKAQNHPFYLYDKLNGSHVKSVKLFHIISLVRFLKEFHNADIETTNYNNIIDKEEINLLLNYTKKHFFYYKKFLFLKNHNSHVDGVIHGDIFKDNVLFDKHQVKVFDFIDSAKGSFLFDLAVILVGFGVDKSKYYKNISLKVYNQNNNKKYNLKGLENEIKSARAFYALKRIQKHKNTKKAKELL